MTNDPWVIRKSAKDWQCGWDDDKRFHLRYFKSLSMTDKIRAVEEMCKTAIALGNAKKQGSIIS